MRIRILWDNNRASTHQSNRSLTDCLNQRRKIHILHLRQRCKLHQRHSHSVSNKIPNPQSLHKNHKHAGGTRIGAVPSMNGKWSLQHINKLHVQKQHWFSIHPCRYSPPPVWVICGMGWASWSYGGAIWRFRRCALNWWMVSTPYGTNSAPLRGLYRNLGLCGELKMPCPQDGCAPRL